MSHTVFHLRPATPADSKFLALALAEALGDSIMERKDQGTITKEDEHRLTRLSRLCERDDTLYSWKRATLAEDESKHPLGATIAYPGKGYRECMERTFKLVEDLIDFNPAEMEDETVAGESYLDTLAVLPAFRGKGIGTALLKAWLAQARETHLKATLACAPHNAKAKRVYESVGMREDGRLFIFGEYYLRMSKTE